MSTVILMSKSIKKQRFLLWKFQRQLRSLHSVRRQLVINTALRLFFAYISMSCWRQDIDRSSNAKCRTVTSLVNTFQAFYTGGARVQRRGKTEGLGQKKINAAKHSNARKLKYRWWKYLEHPCFYRYYLITILSLGLSNWAILIHYIT